MFFKVHCKLNSITAHLLLTIAFGSVAVNAAEVKPPKKPVYKIRLNDTGMTTCSDGTDTPVPCPVKDYPGQDAQYGRDKTNNNKADGHAGFSFTKISATGKPLPASAKVWRCVKDNVTGLMWEGKTNDGGLHDKDWTYSWYNPNKKTNGGTVGTKNGGTCKNNTGCDTYAYVKAVNNAGWCGYKDWRMPTRWELFNLLSWAFVGFDKNYFPEADIGVMWTSSSYALADSYAWNVGGGMLNSYKSDTNQVRLVRG